MINQNNVLIFDIDGVITDPSTKSIIYPEIISILQNSLNQKIPICFNTGRSVEWVQKTIISQFSQKYSLEYLFSSCEMGNLTLEFDNQNKPQIKTIRKDLIPEQLSSTIKEIVQSSYNDSMFIDETKKSILTIEMKNNYAQSKYEILQSKLSGEIRIILKNYHPGIHIRPSSSNIAIDVKSIDSNKQFGAEQILNWLKLKKHNQDIKKLSFISFGDSLSDLEMASYFDTQGFTTKFIYVGTENISQTQPYQTVKTKHHYSKGTLEYLVTL